MMYFDATYVQQLRQLLTRLTAHNDAMEASLKPLASMLDTLLAEDARSLLATSKFAQFVHLLLAEMAANPHEFPIPVHISADPRAWLLPTLPLPLRLWRSPKADTATAIEVQMELGKWQQTFTLLTAEAPTNGKSAMQLWVAIANQIEQTMPQLPIAPALQYFLAQELMCILCFVSELDACQS